MEILLKTWIFIDLSFHLFFHYRLINNEWIQSLTIPNLCKTMVPEADSIRWFCEPRSSQSIWSSQLYLYPKYIQWEQAKSTLIAESDNN